MDSEQIIFIEATQVAWIPAFAGMTEKLQNYNHGQDAHATIITAEGGCATKKVQNCGMKTIFMARRAKEEWKKTKLLTPTAGGRG